MVGSIRDIAIQTAKQRAEVARNRSLKNVPSELYGSMIWSRGSYSPVKWDKAQLITQAYERNPAYFAAVNILMQTVAGFPIYVKAGTYGNKKRTESHPILRLFDRNEDRREYIERFGKYWLVTGDGYAQIVESDYNRKPLGLIVMPSQHTKNIQGDWKKPILEYEYFEKTPVKIPFEQVIHVMSPSLSSYFQSMPAAIPLAETLDLNNASITWNKNTALAGGTPPVIGKAPGIGKSEAISLKEMWRDQRGANNHQDLTIIPENLDIEHLNITPHDAEWEQAILQSMRMILMCLGVSSSLLNDAGNKTYNNVHDARKALYTEAAIPLAEKIYGAHTRKLQPYYKDNPEICIDVENIDVLQEDKEKKAKRVVLVKQSGLITTNEGRHELGLPPSKDENADKLENASIVNNLQASEETPSVASPNEQQI